MLFNINQQKQIKIIDNFQFFTKPSFIHLPTLPPKSYIQTNFSKNTFSQSNFFSCKLSSLTTNFFQLLEKKLTGLLLIKFLSYFKN